MTKNRTAALEFLCDNKPRFLESLKDFVAIPSVSTGSERNPAIQKAADWMADDLRRIGIQKVQVMSTGGFPVVYGELRSANPSAPTVLIYGHYDVQPAEPLELWDSPAFEPQVRGDYIYGRGVTDMKGQVLAVCSAVEAIVKTGQMPVHIKFLVEGEEEIGSRSMADYIASNRALLSCDYVLNPDTGMHSIEQPSITYALRGMAFFELWVHGPDHDLHSGTFGGVVHNPAVALCELIAGMHDERGKVTLPGFYDRVREISQEEREELARICMDEAYFKSQAGVSELWGEQGYTPVERVGARPTLEVNGLLSGFTGGGRKTVLPAWAMANISCRLVPDQDPEAVHQQMRSYLQHRAPRTVRWELNYFDGSTSAISKRESAGHTALMQALEAVWNRRPVFRREGGSVPVVGLFQRLLGVESLNTGFSCPDDNMHSPNEKLHLPTWYRGMQAMVHFFFNLGENGS